MKRCGGLIILQTLEDGTIDDDFMVLDFPTHDAAHKRNWIREMDDLSDYPVFKSNCNEQNLYHATLV